MSAIPLVEASGSHHEVGRQIGKKCQAQIRASLDLMKRELVPGVTWGEMLDQSRLYLNYSREVFPQYVNELEGIAEGSQVSFDEIFLSMCEELWEAAAWRSGCTDMAARGSATSDGSTLIAHTNDLLPESESNLVLLKIQAHDEPQILAVSPGAVAISAGFNSAGVSLTGNQLDNNDIRPGVPRLLVVRAILGSKNLSEAMEHCLLPQRASSYNNVLADNNGEVYCMEGSASDCEAIYIEKNILAHSNHFLSPFMRRFEANPGGIGSSIMRYNRAVRLLGENYGRLSPQLFKKLLADHAGFPASICKHGLDTVTVFSIIIQLEELRAWIGKGRACQAEYFEYALDQYQPH